MRPSIALRLPRQLLNSPFHSPPPQALLSADQARLDLLLANPQAKPRVNDPVLPPRPYPSPLDSTLRPGRKPQRKPWLGPEDHEVVKKEESWVVNPLNSRSSEAEGRKPNEWFVRRVDGSGFLPVYTDKVKGSKHTLVSKVEGNSAALLHPLLRHLSSLPSPKLTRQGVLGRVNPINGQIELRGSWKSEVEKFLVEKGM